MKEGDNDLGWMIVEVKGFRKLAGRVTETTLAGHGVIRVDVYGEGDEIILTQLYPPDSLHGLTFCTEAEARRQSKALTPEPVKRIESPGWPTPQDRYEGELHQGKDDYDRPSGYYGEDDDVEEEEDDVTF